MKMIRISCIEELAKAARHIANASEMSRRNGMYGTWDQLNMIFYDLETIIIGMKTGEGTENLELNAFKRRLQKHMEARNES